MTEEELTDLIWEAMDNRSDMDVGLRRDYAKAAAHAVMPKFRQRDGALFAARTRFADYERQHSAKTPPDTAKAAVNALCALMCAIAMEEEPGYWPDTIEATRVLDDLVDKFSRPPQPVTHFVRRAPEMGESLLDFLQAIRKALTGEDGLPTAWSATMDDAGELIWKQGA